MLEKRCSRSKRWGILSVSMILVMAWISATTMAAPLPGGTLDPLTIPKYVQPLVIPPEMPTATVQPAVPGVDPNNIPAAKYNIAVRQFQQQILPGGVWNTVNGRSDAFPPTPIWSYGPEQDLPPPGYVAPAALGSPGANYNYPAFTVENLSNSPTTVRWINDLKDPVTGNYLPHILTNTVDQTLHWANPTGTGCVDSGLPQQTDCATLNPAPYTGPVPIVTHVHGAHVNPESDGYPEAWWLPAANNIPAGYITTGTLYTQYDSSTGAVQDYKNTVDFDPVPGAAFYSYENSQPAATLWYHDHALGMTRLNVYAGPAGFWLIRGSYDAPTTTGGAPAVLPGPAPSGMADPNFDPAVRQTIREIPIVIQDRSFNTDGSLFYPNTRAFFDGFNGPYVGDANAGSDIAPIWNPEAFFNTMVVNGTTWPQFEVAPAKYRFRLLNGSNSRFINLSMFEVIPTPFVNQVDAALIRLINRLAVRFPARAARLQARLVAAQNQRPVRYGIEVPFYQIGGDQGFLPNVVMIQTGSAAVLPGDGTIPAPVPLPDPMQALLMAPAERADVIVDFSGLPNGTIVRVLNTAPDAPFGGFPDIPADPATSGQVMQFVVNNALTVLADATTTSPLALTMNAEPDITATASVTRQLSLNEEESAQVCVTVGPTGAITTVATFPAPNPNIVADCAALGAVPQAPKAALLGTIGSDPLVANSPLASSPMLWRDPVTENPALNSTENWDFYNLTVDGHPIHMHLVRYEIVHRQLFDPLSPTFAPIGAPIPPLPNELGMKDTVLTYPGEITRVKATFDIPGLYVWHCHIVEHEDNEMMRPYYVGTKPQGFPVP
ncbi:multicopper oxidase domain-containing protein [Pelobacter seleniigenes]|uniref:multicopper oxidase domain-containing protein n=1 Tax=Pelobacter seleniigenes TaxID=407188 RepID=UPI00068B85D9|nr:multicopper oxidase domain-containing protein [Pelobacter seleniigenes]